MENLAKGSIVLYNGVEYFFIRYSTEKTCRIADCKEDVERDYGFFVNTSHLTLPAVEIAKVETTQAPAVVLKTYNEISAVVEKYIVDLAKGKKDLEFITDSYIAKIGIEVARVLGKGGGHLIEIIGNYQEYLPKQINDIIDFHNCLYACRTELSGVTPPTPTLLTDFAQIPSNGKEVVPMPADFAEEVISQIFSNDKSNNFESSDDCLADGVKIIMQQPTKKELKEIKSFRDKCINGVDGFAYKIVDGVKMYYKKPTKVVRKETIALRLLHFFNAHAKQYNCIAIDNIKSEKEFIDAYCKVENVCIALGIIQNFVSSQMYLAMQAFAEQEFEKEIYFSENKTEFAKGDLVIDKYGNSFEVSKIENELYLRISEIDLETVWQTYKAEELRLVCQYEYACLFEIEPEIESINAFFDIWQFDKTYHVFWIYKLQNLSGEDKEYIIRKIADLDKEFAKFLCQKVLPKIPDYKELYDFLELTY